MLLCLILAIGVVLLVAIPARREGRDVLTTRGENVVGSMKTVADSARSRLDRSESADDAAIQGHLQTGRHR